MGKYSPYYIVLLHAVIFRNATQTSNMDFLHFPLSVHTIKILWASFFQ
jgi:hypothetical protein